MKRKSLGLRWGMKSMIFRGNATSFLCECSVSFRPLISIPSVLSNLSYCIATVSALAFDGSSGALYPMDGVRPHSQYLAMTWKPSQSRVAVRAY
jgi:hypothetical protein